MLAWLRSFLWAPGQKVFPGLFQLPGAAHVPRLITPFLRLQNSSMPLSDRSPVVVSASDQSWGGDLILKTYVIRLGPPGI